MPRRLLLSLEEIPVTQNPPNSPLSARERSQQLQVLREQLQRGEITPEEFQAAQRNLQAPQPLKE